ncbi:MAG: hypothetical protein OQK35_03865 [Alphaproteobacteria bacterium]|nr:hypothetical protein [Rhodospirillales bacterium]MCW9045450.1 hypothetical protein [Alphaproteobacteria bacterium]
MPFPSETDGKDGTNATICQIQTAQEKGAIITGALSTCIDRNGMAILNNCQ